MMQNQNNSAVRFKTMLCKHYETPKGCVYKDKCQFAHGAQELKSTMNTMLTQNSPMNQGNDMNFMNNAKKLPNPSNYKIVKCKNFEKDGNCKYGSTCTFAHGDTEIRSKVENQILTNPSGMSGMGGMNTPFMFNPYQVDPMFSGMPMGMPSDFSQMYPPNMYGMDPNNINLNANPQMGMGMNQFGGDMSGMGMPFYPGMYQGMGNPQQQSPNRNQQNN